MTLFATCPSRRALSLVPLLAAALFSAVVAHGSPGPKPPGGPADAAAPSPQLTPVTTYADGRARAGFIDPDGKIVLPLVYEFATYFAEGLASVAVTPDRWGYIDRTGRLAIAPTFEFAGAFHDGRACVALSAAEGAGGARAPERNAVIDATGKVVFETGASAIEDFHDGLAYVTGRGFVDRDGKTVVAREFEEHLPFSDGRAAVRIGERWGFIDAKGALVIPATLAYVKPFSSGYAPVLAEPYGKWTFVDKAGKPAFQPFFQAEPFQEGLAAVEAVEGSFGFIDVTGALVIPAKFRKVTGFSEGLAAAWPRGDEQGGFIDRTGAFVFRLDFFESFGFREGVARITSGMKLEGYVNRKGVTIWPPKPTER